MTQCVDLDQVRALLARYRWSGNFVRAYCKAMGWRGGVNGAPQEWHDAFRGKLGDTLEQIAKESAP